MSKADYADPRYRAAVAELRRRNDNTCRHCGREIDKRLRFPHPLSWSADHIVPLARLPIGDDRRWHIENLQPMHLRCNESKQANTSSTRGRSRPVDPLPW